MNAPRKAILLRFASAVLAVLFASPLLAADEHSFFIERIDVTGASQRAVPIVLSESALREGNSYDEVQLHAAMSRIRHLPFVLGTDFRLEKGTAFGQYVLVIAIRQTAPFFVNVASTTHWERDEVFVPRQGPTGETEVDQRRNEQLVAGARFFVGANGMLNAVAERVTDRRDRYTVTFTEYAIGGTRAAITAAVSYLRDPGARHSGLPPERERFDWHVRDNFTWELIGVLPLGNDDWLRGSWERSQRPTGHFQVPDGQLYYVLESLPQTRRDLFWIHDTTNDPLLPTSGTRITAGIARTNAPTASFADVGRIEVDEITATAERTWPLPRSAALTFGGSHVDSEHQIATERLFGRWSADLWGRERTIRQGDLRLEVVADREMRRRRHAGEAAHSTVRAGIVYRTMWGVVRLDFEYLGWRQP